MGEAECTLSSEEHEEHEEHEDEKKQEESDAELNSYKMWMLAGVCPPLPPPPRSHSQASRAP